MKFVRLLKPYERVFTAYWRHKTSFAVFQILVYEALQEQAHYARDEGRCYQ